MIIGSLDYGLGQKILIRSPPYPFIQSWACLGICCQCLAISCQLRISITNLALDLVLGRDHDLGQELDTRCRVSAASAAEMYSRRRGSAASGAWLQVAWGSWPQT